MARQQRYTLAITTLTPLHIGGREGNLLPMDFAFYQGQVYVISEELLAAELNKRGLLENFSRGIIDEGRRFNLETYLERQHLLQREFLARVALYTARGRSRPRAALRPFVRDGLLRPFVPGSAVKGALRVAVLYTLLKQLPSAKRQSLLDTVIGNSLRRLGREPRMRQRWFQERVKKEFPADFEPQALQRFRLSADQRGFDPHTDLFRVLKVFDSPPLAKDALTIEEIKVVSFGSGPKQWSIFAECLPAGSEFTVELHIDLALLEDFARYNPTTSLGLPFAEVSSILRDPLQGAAAMVQDVLAHERQACASEALLRNAFRFPSEPNVRLGWGGGLLSTTVDLLLPEKLRADLRDLLFTRRPGFPAPKSRRVTRDGVSLGWARARCL